VEESVKNREDWDLAAAVRQTFGMEKQDVRGYSPLTLAFLGDAVYEIVIRTMVVSRANTSPNQLNRQTSALAKAETQARLAHLLEKDLTEEEMAVWKRGRNARSATKAKNATVIDYRMATGLEALLGYLYLEGQMDRILELMELGLNRLQEET
jgi:ribonuclease-3 family protein